MPGHKGTLQFPEHLGTPEETETLKHPVDNGSAGLYHVLRRFEPMPELFKDGLHLPSVGTLEHDFHA